MRKKEAIMNLMLGFILSFSLSLVGTIRGGHFTMSSWLISFTISFVTAQVIAQLVPYKMLIDDMCKKKKIFNNSVKGILLGALIVDLSYTPIMSTTMASLMGWLSAKKAPVGAHLFRD